MIPWILFFPQFDLINSVRQEASSDYFYSLRIFSPPDYCDENRCIDNQIAKSAEENGGIFGRIIISLGEYVPWAVYYDIHESLKQITENSKNGKFVVIEQFVCLSGHECHEMIAHRILFWRTIMISFFSGRRI